MGESNYLTGLYGTVASALKENGRLEEAGIYEKKATPEYMQSRISEVSQLLWVDQARAV
jgi:hypothetical protein